MTRGEALAHQNIQYMWLPMHKKSLEHSFLFFFMMDTTSSPGLNCVCWKEVEKAEKKCKSNLYDQNTVLLSSCQIRSWICFWWLAQMCIFPLARKKVSFRVFFFYFISLEGKTQQQQRGLELQLMNSNNFCSPQNSWRGQWNHKLHGAHPFLNAAFLSQRQTALLLTKVIFI